MQPTTSPSASSGGAGGVIHTQTRLEPRRRVQGAQEGTAHHLHPARPGGRGASIHDPHGPQRGVKMHAGFQGKRDALWGAMGVCRGSRACLCIKEMDVVDRGSVLGKGVPL